MIERLRVRSGALGRNRERPVAIACAVVAVTVGGLAVVASIAPHGWKLSTLVRMAHEDPIARLARQIDPEFVTSDNAHYDGVYYYAIALDPFGKEEAHNLIDFAAYRYGHPGYAWFAWVFAAGHPEWVPMGLLVVGLLAVALASALAALLSARLGRSPWGGLVVALNPGIVFALTSDLSESVVTALLALALLAWLGDRLVLAAFFLVALCLTKEPYVLVPLGLAAWEGMEWLRGRRRSDLEKRAAVLISGPLALLLWQLYIRIESGQWSFAAGPPTLTFPFEGWIDSISFSVRSMGGAASDYQRGAYALPVLVVVGAALLIGIWRGRSLRHPIDSIFIFQALLVFCMTPINLAIPKDGIRTFAIPLVLLAAVLALRRAVPEPLPARSEVAQV